MSLRPPFIYFGGKRRVAPIVWRAFGDVPNYVEPFGATLAVLLGRPTAPKLETVNDLNCYIANFWRAIASVPDEVARYADWPVNETDLHARHKWLVEQVGFRERMLVDPDFFDAKIAGWWVWGVCAWIGHGWCSPPGVRKKQVPDLAVTASRGGVNRGRGIHSPSASTLSRQLPVLSAVNTGGGNGVHAAHAGLPSLGHSGRGLHSPETSPLVTWFGELATRLRRVRVACGDWSRIVSGSITGASNAAENMGMQPCAVFLDPPYDGEEDVYSAASQGVARDVRAWAIANGDNPRLRIALCGYESEESPTPPGWRAHAWKASGGYGNRHGEAANENARRERIWFSPQCLPIDDVQTSLALFWDEQP
jgi:hypothetical protein